MLVLYSYMKIKAKQGFVFIYIELRKFTQDFKKVERGKSCIWNFIVQTMRLLCA